MTGVRDALADYLQLRRRLGFEMPQDGRLLEGFVTFLERAGAERISTDLALAWARLTGAGAPVLLGSAADRGARVRAPPGDARPGQRGPGARPAAGTSATHRPLHLHR